MKKDSETDSSSRLLLSRPQEQITQETRHLSGIHSERRPIILTALGMMIITALTVAGVAVYFLYQNGLEQSKSQLVTIVRHQVRLIEAVSRFDVQYSQQDHPDGATGATLSQVLDGYLQVRDFAKTGEIIIGQLDQAEMIIFLQPLRHASHIAPIPLGQNKALAEPMRQALMGQTGSMVSTDYRGVEVLVAYQPIPSLSAALVAKIDLQEVREPFIRAISIMGGMAVVIIVIGGWMMVGLTNPLIRRAEKRENQVRIYAKELEQQTQYRQILTNLLQTIVNTINETSTDNEILQQAIREICSAIGWEIGHVYVVDHDTLPILTPSSWWYIQEGQDYQSFQNITMETTFLSGIGLPGRVFETGRAVWIEDVKQDLNFPRSQVAYDIGVRGGVGIPIVVNHQVSAVLEMFMSKPLQCDPELLKILTYTGILLGRVIERKHVGQEILELHAKHQLILQSAGEGIYGVNTDGQTTFVNPAAAHMLGYHTEELLGTFMHGFVHHTKPDGTPYPQETCPMYAAFRDGAVHRIDTEVLWRKDGTSFPAEYTSTPIRHQTGEIQGAVITFKDISERKQAAHEHERLQSQLLTASHQAGMAELAMGVLHNVGNVLNSANVSASLLQTKVKELEVESLANLVELLTQHADQLAGFLTMDPTGQQIPLFLQEITKQFTEDQQTLHQEVSDVQKNIEHICAIIEAQQKHAKTSSSAVTITLQSLIEDALQMAITSYSEYPIRIIRRYDSRLTLTTDRNQVLQILTNIFHNARHALRDSGQTQPQLEINFFAEQDARAIITVKDNGIGIAPEHLDQIFNFGFTTKSAGNGYGLHTAALAAKELGGNLFVESQGLGLGATFRLELPIEPVETQGDNMTSNLSQVSPAISREIG